MWSRCASRAARRSARPSATLLLDGPEMTAWAEAALFAAARAELAESVIRPALERDAWVSATASSTRRSPTRAPPAGLGIDAVA